MAECQIFLMVTCRNIHSSSNSSKTTSLEFCIDIDSLNFNQRSIYDRSRGQRVGVSINKQWVASVKYHGRIIYVVELAQVRS